MFFGFEQGLVLVETDNKAAGHVTTNPNITEGLAHLEPQVLYCRVLYQQKKVLLGYIHIDKLIHLVMLFKIKENFMFSSRDY